MIEFIQDSYRQKTFSYPYSLYQDLLTVDLFDVAHLEQENANHSFSYYRRIDLTGITHPVELLIKLPDDYGYHLNGFRYFIPSPENGINPTIRGQIFHENINRVLNDEPAPIDLVATPAEQNTPFYFVRVNETYFPAENLKIRIFGQDGINPAYIDIMTMGIYITRAYRTNY